MVDVVHLGVDRGVTKLMLGLLRRPVMSMTHDEIYIISKMLPLLCNCVFEHIITNIYLINAIAMLIFC